MVSIKLVIGLTHGKCPSTQIPQNKQEQEVIFSRKYTKEDHPPIYFSNIPVTKATVQKHIGMYLDEKRTYKTQKKEKLSNVYKGIDSSETSPINFEDKLLLQFIRSL